MPHFSPGNCRLLTCYFLSEKHFCFSRMLQHSRYLMSMRYEFKIFSLSPLQAAKASLCEPPQNKQSELLSHSGTFTLSHFLQLFDRKGKGIDICFTSNCDNKSARDCLTQPSETKVIGSIPPHSLTRHKTQNSSRSRVLAVRKGVIGYPWFLKGYSATCVCTCERLNLMLARKAMKHKLRNLIFALCRNRSVYPGEVEKRAVICRCAEI